MATRSMIAIEKESGTDYCYDASYCHWDGYPSHNGWILSENYNTEQKVNNLLSKGEISTLGKSIKDSVFYTQRGDDLNLIQDISFSDLKKRAENMGCEYLYVFFPERDVWQYASCEDNFCSMKDI